MTFTGPVVASRGITVKAGDIFRLVAYSNLAVTLRVEIAFRPVDWPKHDVVPLTSADLAVPATRASTTVDTVIQDDGFIEGCTVINVGTAAPQRGQTYASLALIRNFYIHILATGYIYGVNSIALGNYVEPGPAGGHGALIHTEPASPAAGADYSETVPTGALRLYRASTMLLTSSVAAANRQFGWLIIRSGGAIGSAASHSEDFQVASSAVTYEGALGVTDQAVVAIGGNIPTGTRVTLPLPLTYLYAGDVFRTFIVLIQGADQISSLAVDVEEWVMPN